MLEYAPGFDAQWAANVAHDLYGLRANARPLTGERDQNFLIESDTGERLVLKVANAIENPDFLNAQQEVMQHLAHALDFTPQAIRNTSGEFTKAVAGPEGRPHQVWAVTFLPGMLLSQASLHSTELLEHFGHRVGELAGALSTFDHPAIHRDFHWHPSQSEQVIARHWSLIADHELSAIIDGIVDQYRVHVAPLLSQLRLSAIHGDLNDNNVLVNSEGDLFARHQRVVGVVDFGDMVHAHTIADLAIATAYACLDARDPLAVVAAMVRGYRAAYAPTEAELAALWGMMLMRLATSASIAAWQSAQNPHNAYLDISQSAIRRTLPRLARIPFGLAHAVVRDACGLEPVATSARVRTWLHNNTETFAPVIDCDLRVEPCTVLDLSIGSPLVSGNPYDNEEPRLTPRINAVLDAQGTHVGIGRYDEPRLLYTAPFFATGPEPNDERRTVHIGLDLFAPAGTPVFAPLDGTLHAFAENPLVQDYGPVMVLQHETADGDPFFTLYGHLSRESLTGLSVGARIRRGQRIASFGTPDVNVGWTPHLHLQIMTDMLELGTDCPGVAPNSQRSVWRSLCPDPNLLVGIPAERFPAASPSRDEVAARRRLRTTGNLSVAYRRPLRIERGWMQYLFDDSGHRYLDAYNNVPHVGHAHPRVVEAARAQMSVLNTNTRYLSTQLTEYADRLLATLPPELEVCMLVNSASEANELALRMARTYTESRDMIVLEAAYHGNTTTLIDLSPYKHAGPGGTGAPEWVHVAPLPDDYRGLYRRADANAGRKYASHVADIIASVREQQRGLAGFIAETCPSVGGQLLLPAGYLSAVYKHVRTAGGVCIADEVQTGLGRMGTHFWAFQAHDVVPDIVVIGKPLGNGHPMAAVATTHAIANAFNNGMEYFSTFGGNNVSCAVGLAVLDVLRDEHWQAHALRIGERLLAGLRPMMDKYPIVGDVRGSGLFLGVELVHNRETLEPAGDAASYVANRMREHGILLGTDGPHHNVVKIRPPMPFDAADADYLVETFEQIVSREL